MDDKTIEETKDLINKCTDDIQNKLDKLNEDVGDCVQLSLDFHDIYCISSKKSRVVIKIKGELI